MSNNIELAKTYVPLLDEVYANASLTADLDGAADLAKQGANANELIIPMMDMVGLGNYSRNAGYANGDVTLTNETKSCNFDRGRMFTVDTMDDVETAGVAFGRLAGEFERTKVVPELDAFRFAEYAQAEGIGAETADLTTGAQVVSALRKAITEMDNDEVSTMGRILYITPELKGMIDDLDSTKSRAVLAKFEKIVEVPQVRFYTKIAQNDGSAANAGGYSRAEDGANLNFMIIQKDAVIQFPKHQAPKIVTPEMNQDADAYKFGYRLVSIAEVYENKVAGIYAHRASTTV